MFEKIGNWFKPNNYIKVYFIEVDGNFKPFLVKKNPQMQFYYNDGSYNMYYPHNKQFHIKDKKNSIFIYIEGNEFPIFPQFEKMNYAQLRETFQKQKLAELFVDDNDLLTLIKKYWIYILAIIIGFIVLNMFLKGG